MPVQTGVKFVVFSTLDAIPEDVKKALPEVDNTGFVVPHFESKAAIEVSSCNGVHI